MIIIKGTKKIKNGILNLPSIQHSIKSGNVAYVKDEDFWSSDIQIALKMGLVEVKKQSESEDQSDNMVKCVNSHNRPIRIPGHDSEISQGSTFVLSKDEMNTTHIRNAMSKGIIKVVGAAAPTEQKQTSEGKVYVKKRISKKLKDTQTVDEELKEDASVQENQQPLLDTNEELSAPGVIKDNKGVVWNNTNSDLNTPSADEEQDVPVNPSDSDDPRQFSVVVDPNKSQLNSRTVSKDSNNITFVDKKQREEKILSHPVLKSKLEQVEGLSDELTIKKCSAKKRPKIESSEEESEADDINFVDL